MKKRKKTKVDKMAELVGDAYHERTDKLDVLTASLWLLAKGTRFKVDAEEIIKAVNPKFFKDPSYLRKPTT